MNNIDNFVDSVLKVTASEDIDINKDLQSKNITNKTISELLDEKKYETKSE